MPTIPTDILFRVFSYVDHTALNALSSTSREFYFVANHPLLRQSWFLTYFKTKSNLLDMPTASSPTAAILHLVDYSFIDAELMKTIEYDQHALALLTLWVQEFVSLDLYRPDVPHEFMLLCYNSEEIVRTAFSEGLMEGDAAWEWLRQNSSTSSECERRLRAGIILLLERGCINRRGRLSLSQVLPTALPFEKESAPLSGLQDDLGDYALHTTRESQNHYGPICVEEQNLRLLFIHTSGDRKGQVDAISADGKYIGGCVASKEKSPVGVIWDR